MATSKFTGTEEEMEGDDERKLDVNLVSDRILEGRPYDHSWVKNKMKEREEEASTYGHTLPCFCY